MAQITENDAIFHKYRSYLLSTVRKSRNTVDSYTTEMKFFKDFLEKTGKNPLTIGCEDVTLYLQTRSETLHENSSVSRALAALRSFFRFLMTLSLRADNPAALLEQPRRKIKLPKTLRQADIERILSLIDTSKPEGLRDAALIELIYSSGLRASEAAGLDTGSVYFKEALVRVFGKGSKERLVPFGQKAETALRKYMREARPLLSAPAGGRQARAFFLTAKGRRMTRTDVWARYAFYARKAGCVTKVHALRHSFATELLAGGAGLRSVQALLGHEDIATTQIYTHVETSALRETHKRCLPELGLGGEA